MKARPPFLRSSSAGMKKCKAKTTDKHPVKNVLGKKSSTMPADLMAVRQRIVDLIRGQAVEMVEAAIGEVEKAQNAAMMKYLFEMAGLYPPTDQEKPQAEDSLAMTLLQRLGLAEEIRPSKEVTKGTVPEARDARDTVK